MQVDGVPWRAARRLVEVQNDKRQEDDHTEQVGSVSDRKKQKTITRKPNRK
jgi:hypothetical protein